MARVEPERTVVRPPFFDLRMGEGRDLALAAGTLFTFMCGHGVLETARDALFLSRLPPERLPWVYIAMAVGGLGVAWLASRARRARVRRLTITLIVSAIVTAALSLPLGAPPRAVAYVVYVWVGLAATAGTVELWQLLGDRFHVDQAKRLFGLIGAGGVLGVAAGSALAAILAEHLPPARLLLAGSVGMLLAAFGPLFMTSHRERDGMVPAARTPSPQEVLRAEPHARRLLYLALLSTLTVTVADFLFKSTVARSVAPDHLGVFFGRFYAVMNVAALVVQVGATAWILRSLGAIRGLMLLPLAFLAGGILCAAAPVLSSVIAVKVVDGTTRHSIQRTAHEVLFLPLPSAARRTLRGVAEAMGQRGGQALASAGILFAVWVGADRRPLGVALAVLALFWLGGLVGARRSHLELFRRRLKAGVLDFSAPLPQLDLGAVEVLVSSVNSPDEREALGALHWLEQGRKVHLVPPLLAYHPSPRVALRALDLLARYPRREARPFIEGLLQSSDDERRAAALRAYHAIDPTRGALGEHLADPSPHLRAIALVGLASDPAAPEDVHDQIRAIAGGHDSSAQVALARAIAATADRRWVSTLVQLGHHGDDAVLVEVAQAAQRMPDEWLLPALVDMLGRREARAAARAALVAAGNAALAHLHAALADPNTPLAVRRHIPRTLMLFEDAAATRILLERMLSERDGMTRYKILRALGARGGRDPSVAAGAPQLRALARKTLDRIIHLLVHRVALEQVHATTRFAELLVALLREKGQHALERLFRLLTLLSPSQDFKLVYDGLRSDDAKVRAASREVIADTVARDLRDALLVLVDDIPDEEKVVRLRGRRPASVQYALRELERDSSEAVRLMAQANGRELERSVMEVVLAS